MTISPSLSVVNMENTGPLWALATTRTRKFSLHTYTSPLMAPVKVSWFWRRQQTSRDMCDSLSIDKKVSAYRSKGDGEHGLDPAVFHRAHHALFGQQRPSNQRPELDVFDAHRHKLGVRIGAEFHHKDPLGMASLTRDLGT